LRFLKFIDIVLTIFHYINKGACVILKILSWNVNGIRAAAKKGIVDWIKEESPDVLCLQETKAEEGQLDDSLKNIEGYYSYFCTAEKKGYSGVVIYTKVQPKEVHRGFGIERFDREGRVLIAEYEDFKLLNIYFPNGKASKERLEYKMEFYDECLKYVSKLKAEGHKVIICGDVNTAHTEIDLSRPKENEKTSGFLTIERKWIDALIGSGFVDTLREFNKTPENYTWWDQKTRARERNIGWRIDYFFVSEDLIKDLKTAFILSEVMGSDHCPIGIEI